MADYEEPTYSNEVTGDEFGGGSNSGWYETGENKGYYQSEPGNRYAFWDGGTESGSSSGGTAKSTGKDPWAYAGPNDPFFTRGLEESASAKASSGLRGAYNQLANKPQSPMPTLTVPTYTAPVRDEARETQLAQKAAAPGLRAMRSSVTRAMTTNEANPNARRMSLREALAGYGEGLEKVMAGAATTGANKYEREYSDQAEQAKINYQNEVNRRNTEFSAAMQDYMKKFGY